MRFSVSFVRPCAVAAILVSFSIPAKAQNTPPRRSVVIAFSQAEANSEVRELYIAVMGEIAKPGTYHVDPSELNLHSIIQRAGGLSRDATRTIRVIRQGKINHQVNFSEETDKASNMLLPGDLVIADSTQSPDASAKVTSVPKDQTTIRAGYEEYSPNPGIQLALLNVQDYPIVVTLRPEEATAGNIIAQLGQPNDLLANTRIISPSARSRVEGNIQSIQLASGSAVVFDRGYVHRDRLPTTLPKPIESAIAAGAQSGLIGGPRGHSAELRNVGQQAVTSTGEEFDASQSPQQSSPDSIPFDRAQFGRSTDGSHLELPPLGTAKARVAGVPLTEVSRITNATTGNLQTDAVIDESIPQPGDISNDDGSITPPVDTDGQVDLAAPRRSLTRLIVTIVLAGMLVGAGLILRRRFEVKSKRNSPTTSFPPAIDEPVIDPPKPVAIDQTASKTLLERMIKNELPLIIEPADFPNELALQGRLATKPILRVDEPQSLKELNGPHFAGPSHETRQASLQDVITQLDAPESIPRRPHFMMDEKSSAASEAGGSPNLQDSASGQAGVRSHAPLASALIDLQQGGRS